MTTRRIKVAWVCMFSNPEIRGRLAYSKNIVDSSLRKIFNKPRHFYDYGQWITNGIEEFKKIQDVELHVISIHPYINKKTIEFESDGVSYHFFHSEDDMTVVGKFFNRFVCEDQSYDKNRKMVNEILSHVNPDIIHLYGAESPQFSLFALDVDTSKQLLIVSLLTLMSDPKFKDNYPISEKSYKFRSGCEKKILRHTHYIESMIADYDRIIWRDINEDAVIFENSLMVGEKPHLEKCGKSYDFVYFSANINKAGDLAVEAFARAFMKNPAITLLIVGDYDDDFKQQLDATIAAAGAVDNVTITGKLPTHDDVINEIKKARFALLPLKIDFVSGTIREAMACGLPVITTITAGTPTLNENRESVLLSAIGDHDALCENILKVLNTPEIAKSLVDNALITLDEKYGNRGMALKLVRIYKAMISRYSDGTEIPAELCHTRTTE